MPRQNKTHFIDRNIWTKFGRWEPFCKHIQDASITLDAKEVTCVMCLRKMRKYNVEGRWGLK